MGQSIDGFKSLFGTRSSSADEAKGQQQDTENGNFKHEPILGLSFPQCQAAAVATVAAPEAQDLPRVVELLTHHPKTPD